MRKTLSSISKFTVLMILKLLTFFSFLSLQKEDLTRRDTLECHGTMSFGSPHRSSRKRKVIDEDYMATAVEFFQKPTVKNESRDEFSSMYSLHFSLTLPFQISVSHLKLCCSMNLLTNRFSCFFIDSFCRPCCK